MSAGEEEATKSLIRKDYASAPEVLSPVPIIQDYQDFYQNLKKLSVDAAIDTIIELMSKHGYVPPEKEIILSGVEAHAGQMGFSDAQAAMEEILNLSPDEVNDFCQKAYNDPQDNRRQPGTIFLFLNKLSLLKNYTPTPIETDIKGLDKKDNIESWLAGETRQEIIKEIKYNPLTTMSVILTCAGAIERFGLTKDPRIQKLAQSTQNKLALPEEGQIIQDKTRKAVFTVRHISTGGPVVAVHQGKVIGTSVIEEQYKLLVSPEGQIVALPEEDTLSLLELLQEGGIIEVATNDNKN